MFEKNPALTLILALCLGLVGGFSLGYTLKPIPEPTIEVGIDGVRVNGKKIDLNKLKLSPVPALPNNKKSGDLPAGEVERPAAIHFEIDQKHIIKNMASIIDGLGLNVPCCVETIALSKGYSDLYGFASFTKNRPGGHYPEKLKRQRDEFGIGKQFMVSMVIYETDLGDAHSILHLLQAFGPVVAAYDGKFDEHYSGNKVATAVIVNGYQPDKHRCTLIDPNFPQDRISISADKLAEGCQWIVCLVPAKPASHDADCPCGGACYCPSCHCSATPISQVSDDRPIVGQRGGGSEFLGLEKIVDRLIAWLADKGARTEEALAAREAELAKKWESFKLVAGGVIVAGIIPACGIWYSLHRIANASETRVLQGIK